MQLRYKFGQLRLTDLLIKLFSRLLMIIIIKIQRMIAIYWNINNQINIVYRIMQLDTWLWSLKGVFLWVVYDHLIRVCWKTPADQFYFLRSSRWAFTFCLQLQKVNKKSRRWPQIAKKSLVLRLAVKLATLKQHCFKVVKQGIFLNAIWRRRFFNNKM